MQTISSRLEIPKTQPSLRHTVKFAETIALELCLLFVILLLQNQRQSANCLKVNLMKSKINQSFFCLAFNLFFRNYCYLMFSLEINATSHVWQKNHYMFHYSHSKTRICTYKSSKLSQLCLFWKYYKTTFNDEIALLYRLIQYTCIKKTYVYIKNNITLLSNSEE